MGVLILPVLVTSNAWAQPAPPPQSTAVLTRSEYVEVAATRIPEDVEEVPASVTVVTGDDLRSRGAANLRDALASVQGVDVAPGADNGPSGAVVEMWGLKELDAFLLVVDGVPSGGAFNPALETVDLGDVERIEVVRGAAPVMYGATSFVGVIHVVHRDAAARGGVLEGSIGNRGSGGGALTARLPAWGALHSTVAVDYQKEGFRDARTDFQRGRAAFRSAADLGVGGTLRVNIDATVLDQNPASPQFFDGTRLSPLVPLDANHNPSGAFLNDRRYGASVGYDRPAGRAMWSSLLSYAHATEEALRGFLVDASADFPNAHGFRESTRKADIYFDSHLSWSTLGHVKIVAGVDHLHGSGNATGGDFDYGVNVDGAAPPASAELPPAAAIAIHDRRDFSGLYGFVQWDVAPRWRLEGGARLNRTEETRDASTLELDANDREAGASQRTVYRPGGSLGVSWTAWRREHNDVRLYADYRNTYKPAAIDFGLDSDPNILKPETADSFEAGAKARLADGKVVLEVESFLSDFNNLVVSQTVDDLPALVNAGKERLKGIEAGLSARVARDTRVQLAFSLHDARFRDFVSDFGDGPTQVAGNRLPASARTMGSAIVTYAPATGLNANARVQWVGNRFLDEVNTALAPAFVTLAAGVGYRTPKWEIRVDGRNLNDSRAPVSLSEMGSGAFYLLPARRIDAKMSWRF